MQANSFTGSKAAKSALTQIPRSEFDWDEQEQCYRCPRGKRLTYSGRTQKKRHSGRRLWQSRYRCDPVHCRTCPLAAQCLRKGSASRTIHRLEDQELLDAQRTKMADPDVQKRYRIRGQTVERAYADSKENRGLTRFHGRGLSRARAETGLMVVAQNLLRLDRIQRTNKKPDKTQT